MITGASSGIGEATARLLAGDGWRCVLLARREDRLRPLAEEIGGEYELLDVADREAVDRVAAAVLERHPQIGLLMNNAGIGARAGFFDCPPERIEQVTAINYLGSVWCLRAFLPGLEAAAPSDVVNLVSVIIAPPPSLIMRRIALWTSFRLAASLIGSPSGYARSGTTEPRFSSGAPS